MNTLPVVECHDFPNPHHNNPTIDLLVCTVVLYFEREVLIGNFELQCSEILPL